MQSSRFFSKLFYKRFERKPFPSPPSSFYLRRYARSSLRNTHPPLPLLRIAAAVETLIIITVESYEHETLQEDVIEGE